MTTIHFLKKNLLWILPLMFFACSKTKDKAQNKPNIVFVFADDMTYSAIHTLGNTEIHTPNLDRLVHNGTTFTHAYNMGGWHGAICTASRSMLISGLSLWDSEKIRDEWQKGEKVDHTWGQWMRQAGYDTYMSGKWHVLAKADSVFNHTAHIRGGMPGDAWTSNLFAKAKQVEETGKGNLSDFAPVGYNRPLSPNDTVWKPYDPQFGGFWKGGKHWSEVLKDDALAFMDKAKQAKNPFFMYLAFNAAHDPRQSPKRFLDMYPLDSLTLPKSFLPVYPNCNQIGAGISTRDEALAPYPRTAFAVKTHLQEYYAIITHLDEQIGEILTALKRRGLDKNTYIIFTADHGLAMGRHGLLGKQNLFDHSVRVPFIISGPDVPKNKTLDTPIYLQDAMPTALEIAGEKKPDDVFFHSLRGLIQGTQKESPYKAIYGGYNRFQRMIQKNDYKLIVYPPIDKVLLFDMKNDPEEMKDVATQHPEKIKTLFKELLTLQTTLNDTLNLKPLYHKIVQP